MIPLFNRNRASSIDSTSSENSVDTPTREELQQVVKQWQSIAQEQHYTQNQEKEYADLYRFTYYPRYAFTTPTFRIIQGEFGDLQAAAACSTSLSTVHTIVKDPTITNNTAIQSLMYSIFYEKKMQNPNRPIEHFVSFHSTPEHTSSYKDMGFQPLYNSSLLYLHKPNETEKNVKQIMKNHHLHYRTIP